MKSKPIIAFLMCACTLFSQIHVPVHAAIDSSSVVISTDFGEGDSTGLNVFDKGNSVDKSHGVLTIDKTIQESDPHIDVTLPETTPADMVFRADIKSTGVKVHLFKLRNTNSTTQDLITINTTGELMIRSEGIYVLSPVSFTNVSVICHFDTNKFDVYVNEQLVKSNITLLSSESTPTLVRTQLLPNEGNGRFMMDNLQVYEGTSLLSMEETSGIDKTPTWAIFSNNFNDSDTASCGYTIVEKGNSIACENNALKLTKTVENTDPYVEVSLNNLPSDFVSSVDIKSSGLLVKPFVIRDADANFIYPITITPEGTVKSTNNTVVGNVTSTEFTNIAVAYHFDERCFDIYINKTPVSTNNSFPNEAFSTPMLTRILTYPDANLGTLVLDNYNIYVGSEIYSDASLLAIDSALPSEEMYKQVLKGDTVFCQNSEYFYTAFDRQKLSAPCYTKNNELYVPAEDIALGFGYTYAQNGNELSFNDNITLNTNGSLTVDTTSYTITACETKNGIVFVPVKAFAKNALGYSSQDYECGLVVFSDTPTRYTDNDSLIGNLSAFIFSEHPSAEEIQDAFNSTGYKNVHPRLHVDANGFNEIKQNIQSNANIRLWSNQIILQADNLLDTTPLEYNIPDGLRLLDTSREVQDRLLALSYAYQITGDTKYAKRAWKEMEKVCSYPDWNPQHFLDIAEMAYGVAIGYDWCYNYLTTTQRATIENTLVKFALTEGKKQYKGMGLGTQFILQNMNWNAVCNGGLSAAALAVMDVNPDIASYTLEKALYSLDYMLPEFAPDGGWDEGFTYLSYTLKYFCIWMDCMNGVLGTDYNIPNFPGISKTAQHLLSMQGYKGNNNFNDANEGDFITPATLWLGKYFNSSEITSSYLSLQHQLCIGGTVFDCLFYDTNVTEKTYALPLDMVTHGVESGSMRSAHSTQQETYLSYRGGKAAVNHYHLSEGAFVLDALGERWALDLGMDNYTYSSNFSSNRNDLYRIRPEGHNCVVINPSSDAGQSMSADCPITQEVSKSRGAYQVLDLTSAYNTQVNSYYRGYMLTDNRNTAVIRDEISLKNSSSVYWFMHTKASIEVIDNTRAILTIGSKKMQVDVSCEGGTAILSDTAASPLPTSPVVSSQASNNGVRKLQILLTGSGNVSISVRFTPYGNEYSQSEFNCASIAEWDIPDGELPEIEESTEYYVFCRNFNDGMGLLLPKTSMTYNDTNAAWQAAAQNSATRIQASNNIRGNTSRALVLKTTQYKSGTGPGNDPFIKLTPSSVSGNCTLEFALYMESDDATYMIQSNNMTLLQFSPDNSISIGSYGVAGTYERNKWMNVSIQFDYYENRARIWIDGEELAYAPYISYDESNSIKWIALYPSDASDVGYNGLLALDNVRMYSGKYEMYCINKETNAASLQLSNRYPYTAIITGKTYSKVFQYAVIGELGDVLPISDADEILLLQWDSVESMKPCEDIVNLTDKVK